MRQKGAMVHHRMKERPGLVHRKRCVVVFNFVSTLDPILRYATAVGRRSMTSSVGCRKLVAAETIKKRLTLTEHVPSKKLHSDDGEGVIRSNERFRRNVARARCRLLESVDSVPEESILETTWSEHRLLPFMKRSVASEPALLFQDTPSLQTSSVQTTAFIERGRELRKRIRRPRPKAATLMEFSLADDDSDDEIPRLDLAASPTKEAPEATEKTTVAEAVVEPQQEVTRGDSDDESNANETQKYFGDEARDRFRIAYRKLHRKARFLNEEHDEVVDSPRRRYMVSLILRGDLLPEMLIVRKGLSNALDLAHRGLGDGIGAVLATVLPWLPNLEDLRLAGNRWSKTTMVPLFDALSSKQGKLRKLDISRNNFCHESLEHLAGYLEKNANLDTLAVAHNCLDDGQAAALTAHAGRVTALDLTGNCLGGAGAHGVLEPPAEDESDDESWDSRTGPAKLAKHSRPWHVATMLRTTTTLRELDLSWNRVSKYDGAALSGALASNSSLRRLGLAFNSLGNEGAERLGLALFFHRGLAELDLQANGIGARGTVVLAHAMTRNEKLRSLKLDANPIGLDGVRAISRAFNFLHGSPRISLHGCVFTAPRRMPGSSYSGVKRHDDAARETARAAAIALTAGFRGEGALDSYSVNACEQSVAELQQDALQRKTPRTLSDGDFDPEDPKGLYELNLADPYEFCVAVELLDLARKRPSILLTDISFSSRPQVVEKTKKKKKQPQRRSLRLGSRRRPPPWRRLQGVDPSEEIPDADLLASTKPPKLTTNDASSSSDDDGPRQKKYVFAAPSAKFLENDVASPVIAKQMRKTTLKKKDRALRRLKAMSRLIGAFRTAGRTRRLSTLVPLQRRKVTGLGAADAPFASYSRSEAIKALEAHSLVDLDADPDWATPWRVPHKGVLKLNCRVVPRRPSQLELLTADGLKEQIRYLGAVPKGNEQLELLRAFAKDHRYLGRQVQAIVDHLAGLQHSGWYAVSIFEILLPRVVDTEAVDILVETNLSLDQKHALQKGLGQCAPVVFGALGGHYVLDLGRDDHRRAAFALAANSHDELNWFRKLKTRRTRRRSTTRKKMVANVDPEGQPHIATLKDPLTFAGSGPVTKGLFFAEGTAQRYCGSCFRNVRYMSKELCGPIDDDFFCEVVSTSSGRGKLEFDYSPLAPTPHGEAPLTDDAFRRALAECGLPLNGLVPLMSDDSAPKGESPDAKDARQKAAFLEARLAMLDGRFLHVKSRRELLHAHDASNPMMALPKAFEEASRRRKSKVVMNGILAVGHRHSLKKDDLVIPTTSSPQVPTKTDEVQDPFGTKNGGESSSVSRFENAISLVEQLIRRPRGTVDLVMLNDDDDEDCGRRRRDWDRPESGGENLFALPAAQIHHQKTGTGDSIDDEFDRVAQQRRESDRLSLSLDVMAGDILTGFAARFFEARLGKSVVDGWRPGALDDLVAAVRRNEAAITKDKKTGHLVRFIHVVKVRILHDQRGLAFANKVTDDDETIVRTWLGAVLPLCHAGKQIKPTLSAATAALLLIRTRILRPLRLPLRSIRLVQLSAVETDLGPDDPFQYPGLETRAHYDFFDCHLTFPPGLTEARVERILHGGEVSMSFNDDDSSSEEEDDDDEERQKKPPHMNPFRSSLESLEVYDSHATKSALPATREEFSRLFGTSLYDVCFAATHDEECFFVDRAVVDDVPIPPSELPTLYMDVRCRFAADVITSAQAALIAALFPAKAMVRHGMFPPVTDDACLYREEILVALFGRIFNVTDFLTLVREEPCGLNDAASLRLVRRLGVLNVCDPTKPDGPYDLQLRLPDERRMAGLLTKLAMVEPIASFNALKYRQRISSADWTPGWTFPLHWDEASYEGNATPGVPPHGVLVTVVRSVTPATKTRSDLQHFVRAGLPRPRLVIGTSSDSAHNGEEWQLV